METVKLEKHLQKILILCSTYGSNGSASGICVRNVAQELLKRSVQVFCIADSEIDESFRNVDGVFVYGVKQSLYNRAKCRLLGRNLFFDIIHFFVLFIRRIISIPFFPNTEYIRAIKVYRKTKKIIRKEQISVVIGCYRPFESIYTLLRLKKLYGRKIFTIAYHLDLLTSPNTKNLFVERYQKFRSSKVVCKEIKKLDYIVLPRSVENLVPESEKILYTDFPIYVKSGHTIPFDLPYKKNCMNFVYIGTLNLQNRNPLSFIEFLNCYKLKYDRKVSFHIWGVVDEQLFSSINEFDYVEYHGMLANDSVEYALQNSDFIVNISNKITANMIPSKIFQYFGIGKPIINFVENANDASLTYFERYGGCVNIGLNDKEKDLNSLDLFLKKNINTRIQFDRSILEKASPEYVVDKIECAVGKNEFRN